MKCVPVLLVIGLLINLISAESYLCFCECPIGYFVGSNSVSDCSQCNPDWCSSTFPSDCNGGSTRSTCISTSQPIVTCSAFSDSSCSSQVTTVAVDVGNCYGLLEGSEIVTVDGNKATIKTFTDPQCSNPSTTYTATNGQCFAFSFNNVNSLSCTWSNSGSGGGSWIAKHWYVIVIPVVIIVIGLAIGGFIFYRRRHRHHEGEYQPLKN